MKKKIFSFIALALVFAGCAKEVAEQPVVPSGEGEFVVSATIGDPDTRISYTEEDNGFKASFSGNETMQLYFLGSDNAIISRTALNIDRYSISEDGRTANFTAMNFSVPDNAQKIVSYISASSVVFDDEKATVNLSLQENVAASNNCHIIVGTADAADIKADAKTALVKIAYSYKTALLRFKLTVPEGVRPKTGSGTVISLISSANKVHNSIIVENGELAETSEVGKIDCYEAAFDTVNNVATGYMCVWAGDDFSGARVELEYDEETYGVPLDLKKDKLEGGKVYSVSRTLTINPKPVVVVKKDDAGTMQFQYSGGQDVTNDWLSCKDGVVSWTANTTGAPRKATLNFTNGALCTVTQVEADDFRGDWSFKSKIFSNNKFVAASGNNYGTLSVTIGDPLKGETLSDYDGTTYTNNLGIRGLYYDAVLEACVDIDYEEGEIRVGTFMDARNNAQHVDNGVAGYNYACFLPEMGTTGTSLWAAPWNFVQPDLSKDPATDYAWIWFTVSEDFSTLKYSPNAGSSIQYLQTSAATAANAICGITVAVSKTANVDAANVNTTYNVIYQGNSFADHEGLSFTRK